ncbi:MAG TPA: RNA polymerase sigma-70 factor [Pseudosphingobacterium sp.]|nr:RNA polymerase sigma-70 factor [Pseudosphingobacterium sp.]
MPKEYSYILPFAAKRKDVYEEKHLLNEIKLGSERAFQTLFDRYRQKVFSYAFKIIKSRELAEEVLYLVFLKIWQHKELDHIENIEAYMIVLTRNQTLKSLRKVQLERKTANAFLEHWKEADNGTEEFILLEEARRFLSEAIEKLPPQQKMVYQLCKEEGLKYEQVAEQMSISKLTVKTHMQHALRFIRQYLSKYAEIALFLLVYDLLK